MKLLIRSLLLGCALFTSCRLDGYEESWSSCIADEIEKIKGEPPRSPKGAVYQYTYYGKKVYFIPQYCCDMFSVLLDDQCNVLCHPDGGITGGGDGKCSDFFEKRTNEKLIWKDER